MHFINQISNYYTCIKLFTAIVFYDVIMIIYHIQVYEAKNLHE